MVSRRGVGGLSEKYSGPGASGTAAATILLCPCIPPPPNPIHKHDLKPYQTEPSTKTHNIIPIEYPKPGKWCTLERRRGEGLAKLSLWLPKNPPPTDDDDDDDEVGLLASATAWLTAGDAAIAAMAGMRRPQRAT